MRGRVARYNDQKGYGFIRGEDGTERFFHISSVKSFEVPTQGAFVDFTPSQNEKGLSATDIHIQEKKARPEFVIFGDIRVKLSNIKNYGLSSETYSVTVKEEKSNLKVGAEIALNLFTLANVAIGGGRGGYVDLANDKKENRQRRYLYVTTYQKDNYKFYEDKASFNIDTKCKELDNLLS